MAAVKIRHGHTVDDKRLIHYNEEPSTYELADKLAGRRLDRRKNYCIINGQVCEGVSWVESCSGCFETEDGHPVGEYPIHPKHGCHVGAGCEECGHHGVVRHSQWMPIDGKAPSDLEDEPDGDWEGGEHA